MIFETGRACHNRIAHNGEAEKTDEFFTTKTQSSETKF
jgi:hypothetical protein